MNSANSQVSRVDNMRYSHLNCERPEIYYYELLPVFISVFYRGGDHMLYVILRSKKNISLYFTNNKT